MATIATIAKIATIATISRPATAITKTVAHGTTRRRANGYPIDSLNSLSAEPE